MGISVSKEALFLGPTLVFYLNARTWKLHIDELSILQYSERHKVVVGKYPYIYRYYRKQDSRFCRCYLYRQMPGPVYLFRVRYRKPFATTTNAATTTAHNPYRKDCGTGYTSIFVGGMKVDVHFWSRRKPFHTHVQCACDVQGCPKEILGR
ncbi:hypothetical protein E2C01_007140 [Portunus trituberculatus]|uniref:Uncharacterized protein n=1 Tax=Portunus trituberculatus TaxID=210409 RepID=A0A5B7D1L0_PORTR|nr:hypothetical protein [Portunus trituberculatus]